MTTIFQFTFVDDAVGGDGIGLYVEAYAADIDITFFGQYHTGNFGPLPEVGQEVDFNFLIDKCYGSGVKLKGQVYHTDIEKVAASDLPYGNYEDMLAATPETERLFVLIDNRTEEETQITIPYADTCQWLLKNAGVFSSHAVYELI